MEGRKKKLIEKKIDQILEAFSDGLTIRGVFQREEIDFTWSSFRRYLITDDVLMMRYQKSKELEIDLKLSELEDAEIRSSPTQSDLFLSPPLQASPPEPAPSAVEDQLREIEVDSLTPREALNLIYELRDKLES